MAKGLQPAPELSLELSAAALEHPSCTALVVDAKHLGDGLLWHALDIAEVDGFLLNGIEHGLGGSDQQGFPLLLSKLAECAPSRIVDLDHAIFAE